MCNFTENEKLMLYDPSIKGFGSSSPKKKLDNLFFTTEYFIRRPVRYDTPLYKREKWGKIPSGGRDAASLLREFGHTDKPEYPANIVLSLEERLNGCHYSVLMIYCHWCGSIGLDPIHPRSEVTIYRGKEGFRYECIYMRKYKNSIRTKDQLDNAYDGEFLE